MEVTRRKEGNLGYLSKKHGMKRNNILNTPPYWKVSFFISRFRMLVWKPVMLKRICSCLPIISLVFRYYVVVFLSNYHGVVVL